MVKPVNMSYFKVRQKSNGDLKAYVIYFAAVIVSSSVSFKVLFRNCIFRVQIQMISGSSEANPKCTQQLSLASVSRASFCQRVLLSEMALVHIHSL